MDSAVREESRSAPLASAFVYAAIMRHDADVEAEREGFFASARKGRPAVRAEMGHEVELGHDGSSERLHVYQIGQDEYLVETARQRIHVTLERGEEAVTWMRVGDRRHRVLFSDTDGEYFLEVDGMPFRLTKGGTGIVRCPAPSVVLSVNVSPGEHVDAASPLVVLEAMKMETSLLAPTAGTIAEVFVVPNDQVGWGDALVRVETDGAGGVTANVDFSALPAEPTQTGTCREALRGLRRLLLGFDLDPKQTRRIEKEWNALCGELPEHEDELLEHEDEVLGIFADICSLWRGTSIEEEEGEPLLSYREDLLAYLAAPLEDHSSLSSDFIGNLKRALYHYRISSLEFNGELQEALFHIFKSHERVGRQVEPILRILERRLALLEVRKHGPQEALRATLDRLVTATYRRYPAVGDLAREVRYRYFDEPLFEEIIDEIYEGVREDLAYLEANPQAADKAERLSRLVACPQPLKRFLTGLARGASVDTKLLMLEVMTRRYFRIRAVGGIRTRRLGELFLCEAEYEHDGSRVHFLTTFCDADDMARTLELLGPVLEEVPRNRDVIVDLYVWQEHRPTDPGVTAVRLRESLASLSWGRRPRRVVFAISVPGFGMGIAATEHFTFRSAADGYVEDELYRGLHPLMGKRLGLWRLENFKIRRLPSVEDVYLFHGAAHDNPKDERLFVLAEVRDLTPVRNEAGEVVALPHLERVFNETLAGIRLFQSRRPSGKRLVWNRIFLYLWPQLELDWDELLTIVRKLAPLTEGLGLHKVDIWTKVPDGSGGTADQVMHVSNPGGRGIDVRFAPPEDRPIHTLNEYDQKVVKMRQRGLIYPYEIVKMLTPEWTSSGSFPRGEFVEYDLSEDGQLALVERPYGANKANVIVGVIRNFTDDYPEGITRVALLGDPSRALGSLAEAECRRIIAALDLAEQMHVPLEWFAVSAGAKIAMDSGTENMDWIAAVLRRLIEFTQAGGEVNIIVCGINVGAQPYWNAEATMLMHTRGILIMTPDGAMVLTGKQALDYSGGVSAEDNFGIGGYDRIMGPNGQAQYWARDLHDACRILLQHYAHTFVAPGERFPRSKPTSDPPDRDVRAHPHLREAGGPFEVVGEIFSAERNASRKKPFDIRSVMRAVSDQDHEPLERWAHMRDAEIAVVWDAHLGGSPVCLLGIESKPLARRSTASADGPEQWTAGTLFPLSSKKIARAINASSGNRPLVVLANLSGFDGSPESMRYIQLEYGAEIGRAVVNFDGPIVFCVVSRYHGGAFVVFSAKLNEHMEVAAVEGSYSSVIGGAPAAAVVFAREVATRTAADGRLKALEDQLAEAEGTDKAELHLRLQETTESVRSEKLGEVAAEFDAIHSVERAQLVGSVHHIIPAAALRPYLIGAVERGIEHYLARRGATR